MKDCTQFLIDKGFEPSSEGGVYFSSVFEEVVYLLMRHVSDEEILEEIPKIMLEYATEFFEVDYSKFYHSMKDYLLNHQKDDEKEDPENLENQLLGLGKEYIVLFQQDKNELGKYPTM